MLARMDELYRTVKNSALPLSPVEARGPAHDIAEVLPQQGDILRHHHPDRLSFHPPSPPPSRVVEGQHDEKAAAERLWTVLEVRDNGGGIPAELQSRIYEPFFTSKTPSRPPGPPPRGRG